MAKKFVGTVTSKAGDKTVTVTVTRRETHPLYGKQYTTSRKFAVHDEKNEAKKNDVVEIVATRPVSRTKAFSLSRVLEKAPEEIVLKAEEVEELVEETKEDKE
jgi:small subunit ribosomal protein S17